jgi:hypothetical protein
MAQNHPQTIFWKWPDVAAKLTHHATLSNAAVKKRCYPVPVSSQDWMFKIKTTVMPELNHHAV